MHRIELTNEEHKTLVRMMREFLAFADEGRTPNEVASLPEMLVLNKVAPRDYAGIMQAARDRQ